MGLNTLRFFSPPADITTSLYGKTVIISGVLKFRTVTVSRIVSPVSDPWDICVVWFRYGHVDFWEITADLFLCQVAVRRDSLST